MIHQFSILLVNNEIFCSREKNESCAENTPLICLYLKKKAYCLPLHLQQHSLPVYLNPLVILKYKLYTSGVYISKNK